MKKKTLKIFSYFKKAYFHKSTTKPESSKKIPKINESNIFLDNPSILEGNLFPKFNTKNQTLSKNIDDLKEIQKMDFSELTKQINTSSVELKNLDKSDEFLTNLNNIESLIPWKVNSGRKHYQEKNLISFVNALTLMSEKEFKEILKRFLIQMLCYDFEGLGEHIENKFLSKIKKNLGYLKENGYKLVLNDLEKKIENASIELYDVENYFTVGVSRNRKRNCGLKHYIVQDSFIEHIPIKEIILKRVGKEEKANFYIHLHFYFETDLQLEIIDSKNNSLMKNKNETSTHEIILETLFSECDYSKLKKALQRTMEKGSSLDLVRFDPKSSLKIIDFDRFMDGNSFIINKM